MDNAEHTKRGKGTETCENMLMASAPGGPEVVGHSCNLLFDLDLVYTSGGIIALIRVFFKAFLVVFEYPR